MSSLSNNNQTDVTEAFNFTSRYLDDLFAYILQLIRFARI